MNFLYRTAVAIVFALTIENACTATDAIDRMLAEQAPLIQKELQRFGIRSVAVLPFRLGEPDLGVTFRGAGIQTNLAARLERALAAFRDSEKPVDVVFNAWDQVLQRNPGRNVTDLLRSTRGRELIFNQDFKMPVDKAPGPVDAFISGIVEIDLKDRFRSTAVKFEFYTRRMPHKRLVFDRLHRTQGSIHIEPVKFATDRSTLIQAGRGFELPRHLLVTRSYTEEDIIDVVAESASDVLDQDQSQNLGSNHDRLRLPPKRPIGTSDLISLEILYDGQPQTTYRGLRSSDCDFNIVDPSKGQVVTFRLKNNFSEPLACVLAVNGQSTLYGKDASNPLSAPRWILSPGQVAMVRGVYDTLTQLRPIVGLGYEETESVLHQMSQDPSLNASLLGTITLTVFRKKQSGNRFDIGGNGSQKKLMGNTAPLPCSNGNCPQPQPQGGQGTQQSGYGSINPQIQKLQPIESGSETGFSIGLARSIGVSSAQGSFHPQPLFRPAKDWDELKKGHLRRQIVGTTTRGIMVPMNPSTATRLNVSRFGAAEAVSHQVISYFSVANQMPHRNLQKIAQHVSR